MKIIKNHIYKHRCYNAYYQYLGPYQDGIQKKYRLKRLNPIKAKLVISLHIVNYKTFRTNYIYMGTEEMYNILYGKS